MVKSLKIARSFRVPDEIESEILSRLPVKSLLRFKCVKKSWLDFIEDPTFIAMHLNCFGKNSDDFLLYDFYSHRYFKQYYRGNKNNSNIIVCVIELLMSTKCLFGESHGYVIGSSNGLVCLSNNLFFLNQNPILKLYIWNPSTRKIIELPKCNFGNTYFGLSFGFCPKLNDYKVVKVIGSIDFYDSPPSEVQVYSLSMNSWKKIRIANSGWHLLPSLQRNGFINGASHWLGRREIGSAVRILIISFKLDDEVFLEINPPNYPNYGIDPLNVFITEYRDFLSLIINRVDSNVDSNVYYIWVMKEYGVADSWVKQFTIEIPISLRRLIPIMNFENNGELLLVLDRNGRIVWYNTKTKQIEEQQVLFSYPIGHVIRCKESLVSLPGETSI